LQEEDYAYFQEVLDPLERDFVASLSRSHRYLSIATMVRHVGLGRGEINSLLPFTVIRKPVDSVSGSKSDAG
jgi:hypothetical protein